MARYQFENGVTVEIDGEDHSPEQIQAVYRDIQTKPKPKTQTQQGNPYLDILKQAIKAIPAVAGTVNQDEYAGAMTGKTVDNFVRQGLGVSTDQQGLMTAALLPSGAMGVGAKSVTQPNYFKNTAKATVAETAGQVASPINYAIPGAIAAGLEKAALIKVGESTVGKLAQIPVNRIKDAVSGQVSPEVVDRFIRRIKTIKTLKKHLPANFKEQKVGSDQPLPQQTEVAQPGVQVATGAELNQPTTVEKLLAEVKKAKPIRGEQEAEYTIERGKRFAQVERIRKSYSGEARYQNQKAVLKGELPKVHYESISSKFTQTEKDTLFDVINKSPRLDDLESVNASAALEKMFRGMVPTEREIELLQRAFGNPIADALMSKLPLSGRIYKLAVDVFGSVPRATKAAYDLSMPLRQGLMFIGSKAWWNSWKPMFKALVSEEAYQSVMKDIYNRPTYKLMRQAKLFLADLGGALTNQEENFASSLADKIPGVHQSNRAANAFMNKVRADVFDSMIKDYQRMGIDINAGALKAAKFINVFSGRGGGGVISRNNELLNMFLYSARFQASRWQILNPYNFVRSDPVTRKMAIKSLAGFLGLNATYLGLAKMMGGKVELDPRSSDFGEAIFGKTHIGFSAGFDSVITLIARLATNQYKGADGKIQDYGKGKAWNQNRLKAIWQFIEYKEAPLASFISTLLRGKTVVGEKLGEETSVPVEVLRTYAPMLGETILDLIKEGDIAVGVAGSASSIFGGSVSTYDKNKKKKKSGYKPYSSSKTYKAGYS